MYFRLFLYVICVFSLGIEGKEFIIRDGSNRVCMKFMLSGEYVTPNEQFDTASASASTRDCTTDTREVKFTFTLNDDFDLTFKKSSSSWVMSGVGYIYSKSGGWGSGSLEKDNFLPRSEKLGCYFRQDAPLTFDFSETRIKLWNVTMQPFAEYPDADDQTCGVSRLGVSTFSLVFLIVGVALLAY